MAKKKTIKDVEVLEDSKKSREIEEEKTKKNEEELEEFEEDIEIEEDEFDDDFEEDDDIEEDDLTEDEEVIEEDAKEKVKYKKKDKKKNKNKKEGYFAKVARELKKVVWPSFGSVIKYSFAVIIFCVLFCLFFLGVDALASLVKGLFA